MKKLAITALCLSLLLLTACGKEDTSSAAEIQRQYSLIATAQMEAELTYHSGGEERCFTLQCDYTPEKSEVTVTAPETVAGVSSTVTGEELTLHYEGESASVGDKSGLSPLAALPQMLRAVGTGYLLEEGSETLGDIPCCRLKVDTTMGGEGVQCSVWIDEATLLPRYCEFSTDGETVMSINMLAFSCTLQEENAEE